MDAAGIAPAVEGLAPGPAPERAEKPSLACVGDYREFAPAPPLRGIFGACGRMRSRRECGKRCRRAGRLRRSSLDRRPADGGGAGRDGGVSFFTPGTTIVGMRFRPGAAAKWLGLPMSELVGRRVGLARLGKAGARAGRLDGRRGNPSKRGGGCRPGSARRLGDRRAGADMAYLFGTLGSAEPAAFVREPRRQLDMSQRSLRRRSTEAFGYGPKTLERILRFQRFLRLARQGREPRCGRSPTGPAMPTRRI